MGGLTDGRMDGHHKTNTCLPLKGGDIIPPCYNVAWFLSMLAYLSMLCIHEMACTVEARFRINGILK